MGIDYYAHTAVDATGTRLGKEHWQKLSDHLRQVAKLASNFGSVMAADKEAFLAGILHDLGKYAKRFQSRLTDNSIHGINHWAAGARKAAEMKASLASYVIDGHHTGLPNASDLRQTLLKMVDSTRSGELTGCAELLVELLDRFADDNLNLPTELTYRLQDKFTAAFHTRMLFSCLVDADFLDTEKHFDPEASRQRHTPLLQPERAIGLLHGFLAAKSKDGPVNQVRQQLLADCLNAAVNPPGLFTLTAPTGSGKTLASLAFALRHIEYHNALLPPDDPRRFQRVIVVIPYTSIIEQTARVFREDIFEKCFGPDYVLEHHSAVSPREREGDNGRDAEEERLRRARLAAENWASPIVVTTSVQFFESLFAHKPRECRKLHNIARSVVLFDEVQTLPARLIPSILSAVRILTQEPYGATAVFMTATQPAFASAKTALPYGWQPLEISSSPGAMAESLRRTRIDLRHQEAPLSWPAVASQLMDHRQALCVVNTTAHARDLFRLLPRENRFHLSARLCPAHRQEKLKIIRERLASGQPCLLVSTQLIEAGVDVDFPIAFRAFGPLDSIIQTAGRCNREGRHAHPCPVIVFRPEDNSTPPGAYRTATAKTEEYLARHPNAPFHQPSFYAAYFAELYRLQGPEKAEADKVFQLSELFDFPSAAMACRLVGDETRCVLVKWRDGDRLITKLRREKHLSPNEWRFIQRFSVNLYMGEFIDAKANGYIEEAIEGVWFWNSKYDDDLGACHPEGDDFVC